MKKTLKMKIGSNVEFKPVEVWTPTCMLRWYQPDSDNKILQQKYISNTGGEKWCEVEIVSYQ